MSQLADMMPRYPKQKDVLRRVLWLAKELAWSDSIAIYIFDNGKLEAKAFQSPYLDKLRKDSVLGTQDAFIYQAFRTKSLSEIRNEDFQGFRVFSKENHALAIPIHDSGVLYLGRQGSNPFTEREVTHLVALSQQAYFALEMVKLSRSNQALKEEESKSVSKSEILLNKVSDVLELMSELMTLKEPQKILETTGQRLHEFAQFEAWAIWIRPKEFRDEALLLNGPEQFKELDKSAVTELCLKAIESRRTLSLVKLSRLSLPRPSEKFNSVLLCPMMAENRAFGCLFLGSSRPLFSLNEREILSTLALQVGSHFWNIHLHQELTKTHAALKDSQAQLIQSSKMAAIGQLAAGVAHELNTPLGAMNLAIESTLRILEKRPEKAIPRLTRALKSGNQIAEIVSKLLYYSASEQPDKKEEAKLNDVIEDALSLVSHKLNLTKVTVETELTVDTPALASHNELQQILINLLNNAADAFTDNTESPRKIWIKTWLENEFVYLSLRDNGSGMDEETQARAFEPFYTTKNVGSGTGLGLSVTRELIDKSHGSLTLSSILGEGSCFTLKFPKGQHTTQGDSGR